MACRPTILQITDLPYFMIRDLFPFGRMKRHEIFTLKWGFILIFFSLTFFINFNLICLFIQMYGGRTSVAPVSFAGRKLKSNDNNLGQPKNEKQRKIQHTKYILPTS